MQLPTRLPTGKYTIGDALQDGTGLSREEIGWLVAAAAVLTGVLVAVKTVDVVIRLWTPSGGRG
jgi:hypothetical protein